MRCRLIISPPRACSLTLRGDTPIVKEQARGGLVTSTDALSAPGIPVVSLIAIVSRFRSQLRSNCCAAQFYSQDTIFNVFEITNVIDVEFPRSHVSSSRSRLPRFVGDGGENES